MRRFLLLAILALPLGAACSDGGGGGGGAAGGADADPDAKAGPGDGAAAPSGRPAASASTVTIETFQFEPKPLTVPVGTTVTWANNDDILHTATADGLFDLQLATKGATATHTFSEAGTFHYRCTRHPGMEGDVVVR